MSAVYLEVAADVRYWDDATINGVVDEAGTLTPCKNGSSWCPVIRLADGVVMGWPAGTVADIHFKVCDAGQYWLLDADKTRIATWGGYYVPDDFLCPGANGYGDYIILKIDADGAIKNWSLPQFEMACACDDDDDNNQYAWKLVKKAGS